MTQILHRSFIDKELKSNFNHSLNKSVDESCDTQNSLRNWKKCYYYNQLQDILSPSYKQEKQLHDSSHFLIRKYSFEQNLTKIINQLEDNKNYDKWVNNLSKKKVQIYQLQHKQQQSYQQNQKSNSELFFQQQIQVMNQKINKMRTKIYDEQISNYYENSSLTRKIQQRELIKNFSREIQSRMSQNDSYFQYKKNRYFLPKKIPEPLNKKQKSEENDDNEDEAIEGQQTQSNNEQIISNSPNIKQITNINNKTQKSDENQQISQLQVDNLQRKSPLLRQILTPIAEGDRKRKLISYEDLEKQDSASVIMNQDLQKSDELKQNQEEETDNNQQIINNSNSKSKNTINDSNKSSQNNTLNKSGQIMHTLNRRINKLRRLSSLLENNSDIIQFQNMQQQQQINQQQQQGILPQLKNCSSNIIKLQQSNKDNYNKKRVSVIETGASILRRKLDNFDQDDIELNELNINNNKQKILTNQEYQQLKQQQSSSPPGAWLNFQQSNNPYGQSQILYNSNNISLQKTINLNHQQQQKKISRQSNTEQLSPLNTKELEQQKSSPMSKLHLQQQQSNSPLRFPRVILKRGMSNAISSEPFKNNDLQQNKQAFVDYLENNTNNNLNNNNMKENQENKLSNSNMLISSSQSNSPISKPLKKEAKIRSVHSSLAETQSTQPQSIMKIKTLTQKDYNDIDQLPKIIHEVTTFVQSQLKSGKPVENIDVFNILYQAIKRQLEISIFKIDQQLKNNEIKNINNKDLLQRKQCLINQLSQINRINQQIQGYGQISSQLGELKQEIKNIQDKLKCKFQNLNFFYDILKIYEFPEDKVASVMLQIKQREALEVMQNQQQEMEKYKIEQIQKNNQTYVRALQEERLKKRKELLQMRKANFASKLYH